MHLPFFHRDPDSEIIAICDTEVSKLEKIGEKYGIKYRYEDFEDFIRNEEIEAVVIATPNYLHYPMVMASLNYGKDVMCELPIAFTRNEADALFKKAKKEKLLLALSMPHRFRPDLQILKTMIDEDEIGRVRYSKTGWLRTQSDWIFKGWKGDYLRTGGGVFIQMGIHLLEIALWIMDREPVSIVGVTYSRDKYPDIEDTAFAMIRFKDNSILSIEVGWGFSYDKDIIYFNLTGEKGIATLYPLKIYKELHNKVVSISPSLNIRNIYRDAYRSQVSTFIKSVKRKSRYPFTGEDAVKCTAIVESFYKSVREKKEIKIKI